MGPWRGTAAPSRRYVTAAPKSRLGMEKSYPPLLRPEPLELRLLLVTQVRMEIVDRVVHASDRLSHRFQPRLCGLKAGRRCERVPWRAFGLSFPSTHRWVPHHLESGALAIPSF